MKPVYYPKDYPYIKLSRQISSAAAKPLFIKLLYRNNESRLHNSCLIDPNIKLWTS